MMTVLISNDIVTDSRMSVDECSAAETVVEG